MLWVGLYPNISAVGSSLISLQYDVHGSRGFEGCKNDEALKVCSFYTTVL